MIFPVKVLADLGFEILATQGTAEVLRRNGVQATVVRKHFEGAGTQRRADHRAADPRRRDRPGHQHPARLVGGRRLGPRRRLRDPHRRGRAPNIPCITTVQGLGAAVQGIEAMRSAATSASARCRTGPRCGRWSRVTAYDVALRPRPDPRRPRAGPPRRRSRAIRRRPAADGSTARDAAGRAGARHGADVPAPRSGWPPASTRTPSGIDALAALGFGHVEVGTVTGEPQPGNPRPRLFRLPADRAVVNRMGFNNDGAEAVARRLAASAQPAGVRPGVVLGVNIGKTKVVPEDEGRGRRRLREVGPAARAVRRLPRRQRQLAEHPGAARPAGGRAAGAAAGRRTTGGRRRADRHGAAAGQDRPRPRRRRRARGRRPGPGAVGSTASSPPTPRSAATACATPAAEVEALGRRRPLRPRR